MNQRTLIHKLAEVIQNMKREHPLRIGVNGVDCSGKTTLCDMLAKRLESMGRHVIRASIDGFHQPKAIRYKRGSHCPEGYYRDTHNKQAIMDCLLTPLSPGGDLNYRKAVFDYKTDSPVDSPLQQARKDSILIMDGILLFQPEFADHWDLKIFLEVDYEEITRRALKRDGDYLGSEQDILKKYHERYKPGNELYFREAKPREQADIIIDNNDYDNPEFIKLSVLKVHSS